MLQLVAEKYKESAKKLTFKQLREESYPKEADEQSLEEWEEVMNKVSGILEIDVSMDTKNWLIELQKFIDAHLYSFSEEEYIALVSTFFEIIRPKKKFEDIKVAVSCLNILMRRDNFISRDDITLEWEPLFYVFVDVVHMKKSNLVSSKQFLKEMDTLITIARDFFSEKAPKEIFNKFFYGERLDELKLGWYVKLLFTPINFPDSIQKTNGAGVWLEEVWAFYYCHYNIKAVKMFTMSLLARLSGEAPDFTNWLEGDKLNVIFERLEHSFNPTSPSSPEYYNDLEALFFAYLLNTRIHYAVLKHLQDLFAMIESYLCPDNYEKYSIPIIAFIKRFDLKLAQNVCSFLANILNRLKFEREPIKKNCNPIPVHMKLSQNVLDELVIIMKPAIGVITLNDKREFDLLLDAHILAPTKIPPETVLQGSLKQIKRSKNNKCKTSVNFELTEMGLKNLKEFIMYKLEYKDPLVDLGEWLADIEKTIQELQINTLKEKEVIIIEALYSLIKKEQTQVRSMMLAIECVQILLTRKTLIIWQDLKLNWKPLYDIYIAVHFTQLNNDLTEKKYRQLPDGFANELVRFVKKARNYFGENAPEALLKKVTKLFLSSFSRSEIGWQILELFLPMNFTKQIQDRKGAGLWLNLAWRWFMILEEKPQSEEYIVKIFSRLAFEAPDYINWSSKIDHIIARLLKAVRLESKEEIFKNFSIKEATRFFASMLNSQSHNRMIEAFKQLFAELEEYLNPSAKQYTISIIVFLKNMVNNLLIRIICEREELLDKNKVENKLTSRNLTPNSMLLFQKDIDEIVGIMHRSIKLLALCDTQQEIILEILDNVSWLTTTVLTATSLNGIKRFIMHRINQMQLSANVEPIVQ